MGRVAATLIAVGMFVPASALIAWSTPALAQQGGPPGGPPGGDPHAEIRAQIEAHQADSIGRGDLLILFSEHDQIATVLGAVSADVEALLGHAADGIGRGDLLILFSEHQQILDGIDEILQSGVGARRIDACGILGPGSYRLVNDLEAIGTCLQVPGDFITIDLGGWTIHGNGTGSGITDNGAPRRGIVVRNGVVSGFEQGVDLGNTEGATVDGLRAFDNSTGISVGEGSTVSGNTARDNGDMGIAVVCPSNVVGNTATGNGGVNLFLDGAAGTCNDGDNLAP